MATTDKSSEKRPLHIGDLVRGDVKPEKYEKPEDRPPPNKVPPKKGS